jgi:hypothetical protein
MRAADSTRFVDYMSGGEFVICVFGDPGVGGVGMGPGGSGGEEEEGGGEAEDGRDGEQFGRRSVEGSWKGI